MEVRRKVFFLERISCWKSQLIPLPVGVYSVGRSKSAHLIISSKYCNRNHCLIIVDCDSVSIFIEVNSLCFFITTSIIVYACYTTQINIWLFFSFLQKAKSVGGVYVNEERFRSGRVSLKEHDMIGFGNPTNLSREVMSLYGDEIHIYKVRSTIDSSTNSNVESNLINAECIYLSLLSMPLAPPRPPTPPKASSGADSCDEGGDDGYCATQPAAGTSASPAESHSVNELNDRDRAAAVTGNTLTGNEKKCQFSNIVNFRLYDPEDPTDKFLEDWIIITNFSNTRI